MATPCSHGAFLIDRWKCIRQACNGVQAVGADREIFPIPLPWVTFFYKNVMLARRSDI